MDGLSSDKEKALAWEATWNPSFDGKAVVNLDYTFRSVNEQFSKICGVTPAELIGQSFADITPSPIKELDLKNAKLVAKGVIKSYLLPKRYQFSNGKEVHVILLVVGVYDKDGSFLFYVSRIVENPSVKGKASSSVSPSQMPEGLLEYLARNSKIIGTFALAVSIVIVTVYNMLN